MDQKGPNVAYWESDFIERIEKQHIEIKDKVLSDYSSLMQIYDLCFQWITNLCSFLDFCIENLDGESSQFQAYFANVGSACNYMSALRRLIISGHDGPAKALLRSLSDILYGCIIICNDHELSNSYVNCKNSEDALQLWYKKLTSKKIQQALSNIEAELVNDNEFVVLFDESRKERSFMYSEFIHPWYQPALLSFLPVESEAPLVHIDGLHGAASPLLYKTILETNKLLWYFSQLGWHYTFKRKVLSDDLKTKLQSDADRIFSTESENSESNLATFFLTTEMGSSLIHEIIADYWDLNFYEYMEKENIAQRNSAADPGG